MALDGSQIEAIVTNPTRGSHQAYAVTQNGVYVIANSIPLINQHGPDLDQHHRQHL